MAGPNPAIVDNTFVSPRACGSCSFCCTIFEIGPAPNPANTPCRHSTGAGCAIHPTRPTSCAQFQCIWSFAALLDDSWRPDQCRFVMRSGPAGEMVLDVDLADPEAWRREPFYSQIKAWSFRANPQFRPVFVRAGGHVFVVFPEGEIDIGPDQFNSAIQSGYEKRDGRNQPYAFYGQASDPPPAPRALN